MEAHQDLMGHAVPMAAHQDPEFSLTFSETPRARSCPCPTVLSPPFRTLEEILHKLVQVIQEDDCVSSPGDGGMAGGHPSCGSPRPHLMFSLAFP